VIFDATQTILVAAIAYCVWRETASSRAYRDKHLRLQGDRLDVDLLTELRLRRILSGKRTVVAVAGDLQHPNGHEGERDLAHDLKVSERVGRS